MAMTVDGVRPSVVLRQARKGKKQTSVGLFQHFEHLEVVEERLWRQCFLDSRLDAQFQGSPWLHLWLHYCWLSRLVLRLLSRLILRLLPGLLKEDY